MANSRTGGPPPAVAYMQPIITGILIGVAFLLIYVGALHKPGPHSVPVGVVGPSGVISTLDANHGLSGLTLRQVASATQAQQEIKNQTIYAAYVVQGSSKELMISSAHGSVATHTIEGMFTAVEGPQLPVQVVVPVSSADPNGISLFYLIFGMTLGAFLFGQGSYAVGRRLPGMHKIGQGIAFAVVLGVLGTLVTVTGIGILPGSFAAELGVLVLLSASVALATVAVTTLFKDAGVAIATIVLLILGTATSGGPAPANFLPSGFALFTPALPSGAATEALRDIAYYNASASAVPLIVLAAWLVGSVLVILGLQSRRGTRGTRGTVPSPEAVPATR